MAAIKTFIQNIIECEQAIRNSVAEEIIRQLEVIFIIQYVQVGNDILIMDFSTGETYYLIKYGQSITHATVCLLGNHIQSFRFCFNTFLLRNILKMLDNIVDTYPVEIIDLASG